MSFKYHALNRLALILGVAGILTATEVVSSPSTTPRQLPDSAIATSLGQIVNRGLKADKLIVAERQVSEREGVPRSDARGLHPIGCERPFSAMVTVRSDIARRCITGMPRHSSPA